MSDQGSEQNPTRSQEELEGPQRTFSQMWEMYFEPEIKRRQVAGVLPEAFQVWMGQILFPPQGEYRVLFNDEVKGVGLMRANRAVTKGEPLTLADLSQVEKFDLPNDLLDHGHFTIINRGETWGMYFNFLTGRAKAKDRLVNASHFLAAARESIAKEHPGPAVENLFAAAELASKAMLILNRDPAGDARTHGRVSSAINLYSRTGNIDRAFVELFNKLSQQRPNARYGDAESRPLPPSNEDLELVSAVIEHGMVRTAKATDR